MVYISATEAARRLGVSEKTVRRWIQEKQLTAFHPHGYKNRLAIAEQDVEQKARELAEFEQPGHKQEQGPAKADVSGLAKEVEKLRREIVDVKVSVAALEQLYYKLQGQTPGPDIEASQLPLQSHTEPTKKGRPVGSATPTEPPQELPSGSLLLKDFAALYNVNRRTFEDHVKKGLKSEYVETTVLPNPQRADEVKRWLTPDQQLAAIDFWQRHGVPFTLPQEQDQAGED